MRIIIEAAPPAGLIATLVQSLRLADPVRFARHFWRRRELLLEFTRLEFSGRYQGTQLGLAWGLITPLVTLAVYTFVFSGVFKTSWSGAGQGGVLGYALAMFTGLACFEALSGSAARGAQLMSENVNFVKKVVFPLEVLPVSVALAPGLAIRPEHGPGGGGQAGHGRGRGPVRPAGAPGLRAPGAPGRRAGAVAGPGGGGRQGRRADGGGVHAALFFSHPHHLPPVRRARALPPASGPQTPCTR